MILHPWDRIKSCFGTSNTVKNKAAWVFDLAMTGVINKDNAIDQLLQHYDRTGNLEVRDQIIQRIKEVWKR